MQFLIDGYNLMHAMGYLASGRLPGKLEPARRRCLDWLALVVKDRDCFVRVVFDGQNAPRESGETIHRGVRVRFAYRQTADDVIESLLKESPPGLIVVSNDLRLHESARRAKAVGWFTQQFLDWTVNKPAVPVDTPAVVEKPERLSAEAEAEFLHIFERPRCPR